MKSRIWIWPLVTIGFLMLMAFFAQHAVEKELKREIEDQLTVMLETVREGQTRWFADQEQEITAVASDTRLIEPVTGLLEKLAESDEPLGLREAEGQQQIDEILAPYDEIFEVTSYVVLAPSGKVIASDDPYLIGINLPTHSEFPVERILEGEAVITHPYLSEIPIADIGESPDQSARRAQEVMCVAAPIRSEAGEIIAVLGMRLDPHDIFCRFLTLAQFGETGETYAFDRDGVLLSRSRFENNLIQLGLIPDQPHTTSMLSLEIRDPGVDMTKGDRPELSRSEQPLTKMAQSAVKGESGVDVEGYRDYRGVPVVGAWTWVDEFDFGLAIERDRNEAFRSLLLLRWVFRGLIGLILLTTLVIGIASYFIRKLQMSMEKVVAEFQKMGQYQVVEKIGQGGMGAVYKAHHSMMRRPTAIKTLDPAKAGAEAMARFEREVQLTCRLNHPNTIGIYDYGRTPNGMFYYAMEYIEGITLEDLVKRYGALKEGRVIYLMSQVCGSLSEAHSIGLIHRDIKPANIMVTHRGGQPDMVKVFDFGLVKNLGAKDEANLTQEQKILGTPLYLAPEEIEGREEADQRVDIYSLGAVMYYLLTGRPPFTGKSVSEVIMHQLHTLPDPPSEVSLNKISAEMDEVVLACLDKDPEKRPSSVDDLILRLRRSPVSGDWGYKQAKAWWSKNVVFEQLHEQDFQADPATPADTGATVINYENLEMLPDPVNKT